MSDYGYGCSVLVEDNEGKKLIRALDSICSLDECNEVISNRKIPIKVGELQRMSEAVVGAVLLVRK